MINYYATEFIPGGESIGIIERIATAGGEAAHTHSFTDIIFVTRGGGRHIIDGRSYDMKPGSVFFIDRSVPHALEPAGELAYTELILTSEFFEREGAGGRGDSALRRIFYTESEYQPAVSLDEQEQGVMASLLRFCARETERRVGDYREILRLYVGLIMQYLARAVERARSELENRDPAYIIAVTLEYVDKHFTENISQEELAERFRYNSAYFSRMFKKHRGENLSDYITKKRIELAAQLLESTDLSAEQISERVGYRSKPQFYNTFLKYKNMTPRQYRLEKKGNA